MQANFQYVFPLFSFIFISFGTFVQLCFSISFSLLLIPSSIGREEPASGQLFVVKFGKSN